MLDWIILHALAHYLPPEAMALICLSLTAWVVFENWLAKTGKIEANCTLDLITKGWIAPIAASLKGMVSKNGGIMAGLDRQALPGSTGEPAAAGAGEPGGRAFAEDGGSGGPGGNDGINSGA
jgi:hypothetical protein